MTRIEIYRPHPDNPEAFTTLAWSQDTPPHHVDLAGERPGAFALVIEIEGAGERVAERWRVAPNGRVMRARFCELERELEY